MTGLPPPTPHVQSMPAIAGIGLRAPHYRRVLDERPAVGWFEVHSENFIQGGGLPVHVLEQVRRDYPLSLHSVGLSLGSTDPLDRDHLRKLRTLVDRFQPQLVSDHLCWSSVGGRFLNDLLPLPFTREAVDVVVDHVDQAQHALGRRMLVENLSSYLEYGHGEMTECDFIAEVVRRTGCALLLDVNNVHVSSRNHGFDARAWLRQLPHDAVAEIHLAGHRVQRIGDVELLVDTHDQRVTPAVWALYREALALCGPVPTLIEWDSDLPALEVLMAEMEHADHLLMLTTPIAAPSAFPGACHALAA